MAGKEQHKVKDVIAALIATKGMKTVAARRMGTSWKTIDGYCKRHASVQAAQEEAKQQMGDSIESTLLNEALGERNNDGTWKTRPNTQSLIFIAKTHPAMRERGYGESLALTGPDGEQLTVNAILVTKMDIDEL